MVERFSPPTQKSLGEHEYELLSFALRVGHVLSVHQELVRVARKKPFIIYHERMWSMLLAERDMVAVDLASWILGFYEKKGGGLLRKLRAPDMQALRLEWQYGPNDDDYFKEQNRKWRQKAYERLFPPTQGPFPIEQGECSCTWCLLHREPKPRTGNPRLGPSQRDVAALCDRLHARFEPLRKDRNQHRAHRYEKGQPGTAAMLTLDELAGHLEACQELLADLRCLSSNSQFTAYRYEPKAHEEDYEAHDVVDLVLLGNINWIVEHDPMKGHRAEDSFYSRRREAHYARLHAAHDAAGDATHPFNDRGRFRFDEGPCGSA
jgi:hypothetical protein